MAVKAIQLGQVWREEASGQSFLVTKVYNEVFSQFAMLRPADASAPNAETRRIKVPRPRRDCSCRDMFLRKTPTKSFEDS